MSDYRFLVLGVSSAVSAALIVPYIFCRWGIELVDRFGKKRRKTKRASSKGNTLLIFLFSFYMILIMIESYYSTPQTQNHLKEKSGIERSDE
ncbi:MAG: hypothetical protein JJU29_04930 [Verrucomicrobia bacterium]|nr:hypothetical protein [Verrucomicrobiota bacterium]MCH8510247.1 hypothetical protein [Kiritimatiellia bacterium]